MKYLHAIKVSLSKIVDLLNVPLAGILQISYNAKKKDPQAKASKSLILLVGANRFERSTTRTPSECATRLRYAPI